MSSLALAAVVAGLGAPATGAEPPPIRLVLQVTIDGLRGDLLHRFGRHFGAGGFRHLLETGTVYTNALYRHANTETIVGHATLATGASPSVHGMIGNAWFDRETGALGYNIEDPGYPLLPTRADAARGEQVDPAQQAARSDGRSPRPMLAPALTDTLAAFYGGRSRIFAVSGKDRGAVPLAGRNGKAFWFSTDNGDFVTSRYYFKQYPAWVRDWNTRRRADSYAGKSWALSDDVSSYLFYDRDDRPYETDLKGYGRVFPHPFGTPEDKLFYTRLLVSPVGDELTLDFVRQLVRAEALGQDDIPDFLAVSFSGVDAVNHFFGPSSLEQEALIRELDRLLADLFEFIDGTVGLDDTLIVLSADHGIADMPEYMSELGLRTGRLYPGDIEKTANDAGRRLFGVDKVVQSFFRPYLYLDQERITAAGLARSVVEKAVAEALTEVEGIAAAIPGSALAADATSPTVDAVRRNHHPARSGDIYVIQSPYWFLYSKGLVAAMHGSPYRYDAHVPIIFAGPGIRSQVVHRQVHPMDVAPTLAAVLGITPPAAAQGTALTEVLDQQHAGRTSE